jgi:hypothetical protein
MATSIVDKLEEQAYRIAEQCGYRLDNVTRIHDILILHIDGCQIILASVYFARRRHEQHEKRNNRN